MSVLLVCVLFPLMRAEALAISQQTSSNAETSGRTAPATILTRATKAAAHLESLHGIAQRYVPEVGLGGERAKRALKNLLAVIAEPHAKAVMRSAGLEAAASRLMKSRSSSDDLQRLAGSALTLLSDIPVTAEISDERTGSFGRVHIILPRPSRIYAPDRDMLETM